MAFALALSFALALAALLFESLVGYPTMVFNVIGHPVTWLGALLIQLDRRLNRDQDKPSRRRLFGAIALAILLIVAGGVGFLIARALGHVPPGLAVLVLGLLASTCLAQRSLYDHVAAVATALGGPGLVAARRAVSMIVGRDTSQLDVAGVTRASIESLAENFSDGIVAPTLYLACLGLPGGLAYKAINTADSMIGHRTPRHEAFGFASAKIDDLVNWPAARLAGLLIVAAATLLPGMSGAAAWRVMKRDAKGHPSPNAGWPEAAMAGALGIKLGGPRSYAGRLVEDQPLGDGADAVAEDIGRALRLYMAACALNAALVFAGLILLVVIVRL